MAPTICLPEMPLKRRKQQDQSLCSRHRIQNGTIARQQRLELRQMLHGATSHGTPLTPPESPRWNPECTTADSSSPIIISSSLPNFSARIPEDPDEGWKVIFAKREGLLSIVVRTMALVRRNHILQARVNALRAETRDFICSVLSNPENKYRQRKLEAPESPENSEKASSTPAHCPKKIVNENVPACSISISSMDTSDSFVDSEYENSSEEETSTRNC
ncbi:uncharacterized protein Cipc [Prorops nasuta]|uniref:uncharacterized protein Cipc n=1 Tax=Prorops nasuta TaxID=863751 RepID=UPI0034CF1EB9